MRGRSGRLTLGTVYNVLNDFVRAGLIRRFEVGECSCYCANPRPHHHYYDEETGRLIDIPDPQPVPPLPGIDTPGGKNA